METPHGLDGLMMLVSPRKSIPGSRILSGVWVIGLAVETVGGYSFLYRGEAGETAPRSGPACSCRYRARLWS